MIQQNNHEPIIDPAPRPHLNHRLQYAFLKNEPILRGGLLVYEWDIRDIPLANNQYKNVISIGVSRVGHN
jgi:hypothetical protein